MASRFFLGVAVLLGATAVASAHRAPGVDLAHAAKPATRTPKPTNTPTPGAPTATAAPTATSAATPTNTALPTNTPSPTNTAVPTATPTSNPIKHIVFVVKENRTFDDYFGTFPGANGATTYTDTSGVVHTLNHQPLTLLNDIDHSHQGAISAEDGGKMDNFASLSGASQNGVDESDSQLYQSDIPNYWAYAQTFALSDNFFSMVSGPSFGNHLWTVAGDGQNVDSNPVNSKGYWGCDAPQGATVEERDSSNKTSNVYPCFSPQTLADSLNTAGLSWRYYADPPPATGTTNGYVWNALDAFSGVRNGNLWSTNGDVAPSQFVSDAQAGTLPNVSWLADSSTYGSDHPPENVCTAENGLVTELNAVMSNQSLWSSTAIIVTWDDYGGFYDHVYPPTNSYNSQIAYGLRAPAIVISPYAKAGYIDHTLYSYPSLLKFAEDVFNLPSLSSVDAGANDVFTSFDFNQAPLSPLTLTTRTC